MSDESRLDYGTVDVELGGKIYKLKPTANAARAIARAFGGLAGAEAAIIKLDTAAIETVVIAGIGTTSKGGQEKLRDMIFAAGYLNFVAPCREYLYCLSNPSGEPIKSIGDDVDGEDLGND